MKTLKFKIAVILVAIIGFALVLHAQDKPEGGHPKGHHHGHGWHGRHMSPDSAARRQTEFMKKELSLSAEQTGKVQDINLKYAQKHKAMMDEWQKQMEAMHQEKQKELETVLTKEQQTKLQEKKGHDWKKGGQKCKGKGCEKKK